MTDREGWGFGATSVDESPKGWRCTDCGRHDPYRHIYPDRELCEDCARAWWLGVCTHESATSVDQAPFGPDKVWQCDACGYRYLVTGDGGITQMVEVTASTLFDVEAVG